MRDAIKNAKRIVVKVGSSTLCYPNGHLNLERIEHLVRQLSDLANQGKEVILVSSGATGAGLAPLGFKEKPRDLVLRQASAAVGQGLLLEEYTSNLLVRDIVSAQVLLTQDDFVDQRRYKNAHQALSVLLQRGAIPIINENDTVSIEELKVGDNDTLSAQVAAMVQADLLVLLTDVDGLYTGHPQKDPTAKRLDRIDSISKDIIEMAGGAGSSNGTGGMLTKIKAATIATESGVPVYICSFLKEDALLEAAEKTQDGSYFTAQDKFLRNQKQWLAFYAPSQGSVWLDQGAVKAVKEDGKSILVSGVVKVEGAFSFSDIITVHDAETGQVIGKGRTRLGAAAIKDLLHGQKPKGIVIHRDDWITITPEVELLFTEF